VKVMGKVRDILLLGRKKSIVLFDGYQASPTHPSDKSIVSYRIG
jgi:hypothetical protein